MSSAAETPVHELISLVQTEFREFDRKLAESQTASEQRFGKLGVQFSELQSSVRLMDDRLQRMQTDHDNADITTIRSNVAELLRRVEAVETTLKDEGDRERNQWDKIKERIIMLAIGGAGVAVVEYFLRGSAG